MSRRDLSKNAVLARRWLDSEQVSAALTHQPANSQVVWFLNWQESTKEYRLLQSTDSCADDKTIIDIIYRQKI